ncbi:Uncharacterised protein [Moraxella caprae]|uniref:HTH asnC-type domain-containing protein n=1 Tax=Moraxella caprae TaxID=90240 RepID=A0A378QWK5_9GAMM|nr:AsnC family protein [Moraxella caprae]STZ07433.1 Uncharacterised protein [Moraxella caprae]
MTQNTDDTDKTLLNLLQDDRTLPLKTLAEHTGTTPATVSSLSVDPTKTNRFNH